jgi:hypothetical protein
MVRLVAYFAALAVIAMGAVELFVEPSAPRSRSEQARSPWAEVGRPQPAFALSLPELADADRHYAIRRHTGGGGRRDILTFGDVAAAGPFAVIEVHRPGNEPEIFADAPTEIAARLLRLEIAEDVKPAGALDSKFGPMTLVDFALRRQDRKRRCLGFVRAFAQVRMQIAGWYCNDGPEPVDRGTVGCALDRFAALSAGNDPVLAQRFAQAELNRDFCRHNDPIMYATPRHREASTDVRLRGPQR